MASKKRTYKCIGIQHLFASELELATRAFEHFSFCEDWHYLASFRRNIGNLRSLLTFFSPIIGSADLAKNAVNQLGLMLDSLVGWLPDEDVIHSVVAELEQSLESWCAQQVKNKALALSSNAAFTQQLLNLSHWIQQFDCDDQTSIDDFAPAQLKNEWLQLNLSQNRFSISQWMSTKARATMLDLLSEHVQALANQPLNVTQLKAMNRLLSELAATDELMKNQDWLKSLNEKQYSALQSQHRKSTILVGALNRVSRTH